MDGPRFFVLFRSFCPSLLRLSLSLSLVRFVRVLLVSHGPLSRQIFAVPPTGHKSVLWLSPHVNFVIFRFSPVPNLPRISGTVAQSWSSNFEADREQSVCPNIRVIISARVSPCDYWPSWKIRSVNHARQATGISRVSLIHRPRRPLSNGIDVHGSPVYEGGVNSSDWFPREKPGAASPIDRCIIPRACSISVSRRTLRALRRPGFCVVLAITRTKGNEILTGRVRRSIATGIKKTNLLDPIANSRERERERERGCADPSSRP